MQIILHGGYGGDWENAGQDIQLFQRLIQGAEKTDQKILISFLAQDYPSKFPHLELLLKTFSELNPAVQVNIADRTNFRSLVSQHQILFLQGGNSQIQCQSFSEISASEITHNKALIAGSSSGAMILCRHGYSNRIGLVEGKNIVDLALIPHANAWPVTDYVLELQKETSASILLLNEMQMIKFQV